MSDRSIRYIIFVVNWRSVVIVIEWLIWIWWNAILISASSFVFTDGFWKCCLCRKYLRFVLCMIDLYWWYVSLLEISYSLRSMVWLFVDWGLQFCCRLLMVFLQNLCLARKVSPLARLLWKLCRIHSHCWQMVRLLDIMQLLLLQLLRCLVWRLVSFLFALWNYEKEGVWSIWFSFPIFDLYLLHDFCLSFQAMVSGAIGGFLDVAFNFNTQAYLDDNLLG